MAKPKVDKLNPMAAGVMAGIFGVSNLGMEHRYGSEYFSPEKAAELLDGYVNPRNSWLYGSHTPRDIAASAAISIARGSIESDEIAGHFEGEAKSWVKDMVKMPVSEIKRIWPDMTPYVDALMAVKKREAA